MSDGLIELNRLLLALGSLSALEIPARGVARVVLIWTPKTRGLRVVLRPRMGLGRNIGGGLGGEAPGSKQVFSDLT